MNRPFQSPRWVLFGSPLHRLRSLWIRLVLEYLYLAYHFARARSTLSNASIIAIFVIFPLVNAAAAAFYTWMRKYGQTTLRATIPRATSVLVLCTVVYYEAKIGKTFSMAPFFALAVLFRIISSEAIPETIAMAIVYCDNTGLDPSFGITSSLPVAFVLFTACGGLIVFALLYSARTRTNNRSRILRLLKRRVYIEERAIRNFISNHVGDAILRSTGLMQPDGPSGGAATLPDKEKASDRSGSSGSSSWGAAAGGEVPMYHRVLAAAGSLGLIPSTFDGIPGGLFGSRSAESKLCAVIVIKQCRNSFNDSVQNSVVQSKIQGLIDKLAETHRVTPVSRFRGLWIGSIGFIETWEGSRMNCFQAVQLCTEVVVLSKRYGWNLCCSIDHGSIVGGYVGEKMNFEMFGPEVRWAISAVDNQNRPHEIFVSTSVKNLIQSRSTDVTTEPKFRNLNARSGRTADNNENIFVIDNIISLGGQNQCGNNICSSITKSDTTVSKGKSTEIDDFYCSRIWVDDYNSRLFNSIYESQSLIEDVDSSYRQRRNSLGPSVNEDSQHFDTSESRSAIVMSSGNSSGGSHGSALKEVKEDAPIKSQSSSIAAPSGSSPITGGASGGIQAPPSLSRTDFRSNVSVSSHVVHDQGPKIEDYFPIDDDAKAKRLRFKSTLQLRTPSLSEISERSKLYRSLQPAGGHKDHVRGPRRRSHTAASAATHSYVAQQNNSDSFLNKPGSIFEPLLVGISGTICFLRGINEFSAIKSPDSSWLNAYEDLYWPTDDIKASLIEKEQLEHDVHELVFSQCFWQLFTLGIRSDFNNLKLFFKTLPTEFRKNILPNYFMAKWKSPIDQSDDLPDPFQVLYSLRLIPFDVASTIWNFISSVRRLLGHLVDGDDDVIESSYQKSLYNYNYGALSARLTSLIFRNAPVLPNRRSQPPVARVAANKTDATAAIDNSSISKQSSAAESSDNEVDEVESKGISITAPHRLSEASQLDFDHTNENWIKYSEAYRKNIFSGLLLLMWNIISIASLTFAVVLSISHSSYDEVNADFFDYRYASVVFIALVIVVGEYIAFSTFVYVGMLASRFVLILFYPIVEFQNSSQGAPFNVGLGITSSQVMNTAALHLLVLHWGLATFLSPFRYVYVDFSLMVIGLFGRYIALPAIHGVAIHDFFTYLDSGAFLIIIIVVCLLGNLLFEYGICMAFIMEHIIVPHTTEETLRLHERVDSIVKEYVPSLSPQESVRLMGTARYRDCAVMTIHVKPYDVLPTLVNAREAAVFLSKIHTDLIDKCTAECGLFRVCRFSGIFVVVASESIGSPSLLKLDQRLPYRQRALVCIQHIQKLLDDFNRAYKVNTAIGLSLCHGSVTLTLQGSLDASGSTSDIGSFLATKQVDHVIVASKFKPQLDMMKRKVQLNVKAVYESPPGVKSPLLMYSVEPNEGSFGGTGRKTDDFDYVAMLGKGGYGSVHLVVDHYKRKYAVKHIPKKKGSSSTDIMISREFQILFQMKHQNVIQLMYCIISDSAVYLVMEYVRGGNLKQVVEENKPGVDVLMLWYAELVSAIEYVHGRGILHRDIKPVNCMITKDGHLKLGDFGLAKIAREEKVAPVSENSFKTGVEKLSESDTMSVMSVMQKVIPYHARITNVQADDSSGAPITSVTCLVINSDPILRENTCRTLKNMMLEPVSAPCFDQVFDILVDSTKPIDVILIYLGLDDAGPEWNLLKELQKNSISESIPVFALSHHDDSNMQRAAMHFGAKNLWAYDLREDEHKTFLLQLGLSCQRRRLEEQSSDNMQNVPGTGSQFSRRPAALAAASSAAKVSTLMTGGRTALQLPESSVTISTITTDSSARLSGVMAHEFAVAPVAHLPKILENDNNQALKSSEGVENLSKLMIDSPMSEDLPSQALEGGLATNASQSIELKPQRSEPMASGSETQKDTWRATAKELEHHSAVGTANFMAPEIITDRRYDKSVDWWACGVTMYVCTTREHLFKGSNPSDIFHQIIHGDIDLSKLENISHDLTSLVSGFLDRDYKKRLGTMGTREIKRHKFFQCPNFEAVIRSHPKLEPQHFDEDNVTDEEKTAGEKLFRGHGKTKESGRASARVKDKSRSLRNKKRTGRSGPFSGGYYKNRQELLEKLSSHAIAPARAETAAPTEGKKISSMKLYERLLSAGHNSSHNVIDMSIAEDDENSEDDDDEDREVGSGGDGEGEAEGDESMQSESTAAMMKTSLGGSMPRHRDDERVLHSSVYDDAALAAAAASVAKSEVY